MLNFSSFSFNEVWVEFFREKWVAQLTWFFYSKPRYTLHIETYSLNTQTKKIIDIFKKTRGGCNAICKICSIYDFLASPADNCMWRQ